MMPNSNTLTSFLQYPDHSGSGSALAHLSELVTLGDAKSYITETRW